MPPRPTPQIGLLSSVQQDGSRVAIHPSDVKGRFIRWRRWVFSALIAIYVLVPLWRIDGRPAIHLNVAARRFYLFGGTYNAQDFWIVLFIVTTLGFALLFITAWIGRAWCGWACPQTVFLEGVYRRIERWFDGPRERRLKAAPWTLARVLCAIGKHSAYLSVSLVLSHIALALFVSLEELLSMIGGGPVGHEVVFVWAIALTGLLYFNFAFFREQLCTLVCPYGRLQSALIDRHSAVVGYDVKRGEPRRPLVKQEDTASAFGDCVNCNKCVTACPTGIDIRQGLQLECIACAQCIDACDEVMDKLHKPRGLIRFDSIAGLEGERRRVLRPRLAAYGALLSATSLALVVSLATRTTFEAHLRRGEGAPWTVDGQTVRNQFELHLVNKSPDPETFEIRVATDARIAAQVPQGEVRLGSLESFRLPVFVSARKEAAGVPFPVRIEVVQRATGTTRVVEASFLGPRS